MPTNHQINIISNNKTPSTTHDPVDVKADTSNDVNKALLNTALRSICRNECTQHRWFTYKNLQRIVRWKYKRSKLDHQFTLHLHWTHITVQESRRIQWNEISHRRISSNERIDFDEDKLVSKIATKLTTAKGGIRCRAGRDWRATTTATCDQSVIQLRCSGRKRQLCVCQRYYRQKQIHECNVHFRHHRQLQTEILKIFQRVILARNQHIIWNWKT